MKTIYNLNMWFKSWMKRGKNMSKDVKGIAASDGIGIAPAYLLQSTLV